MERLQELANFFRRNRFVLYKNEGEDSQYQRDKDMLETLISQGVIYCVQKDPATNYVSFVYNVPEEDRGPLDLSAIKDRLDRGFQVDCPEGYYPLDKLVHLCDWFEVEKPLLHNCRLLIAYVTNGYQSFKCSQCIKTKFPEARTLMFKWDDLASKTLEELLQLGAADEENGNLKNPGIPLQHRLKLNKSQLAELTQNRYYEGLTLKQRRAIVESYVNYPFDDKVYYETGWRTSELNRAVLEVLEA